MSVHELPSGKWKVRWRTPEGRARSKTFAPDEKDAATAFHGEVQKAKRLGALTHLEAELNGGRQSLREISQKWWDANYTNLAPKTRDHYKWMMESLICPDGGYLVDRPIASISTEHVETWITKMRTGVVAKRQSVALLSQMFKFAMRRGYIKYNPVSVATRPKKPKKKIIRPVTPERVEAIRNRLTDEEALLVSLIAYQGLRPQEALALDWSDVRNKTLLVYAPKTDTVRTVRLLGPVIGDLAKHKLRTGGHGAIFGWPDHRYRNWRKRRWAKISDVGHPYVLRHTYVSLMIGEGRPVTEVAKQAGHSVKVCLDNYAHAFEEYDPDNRVSMEDAIRAARQGETSDPGTEVQAHVS